jgi:hypothetical protein
MAEEDREIELDRRGGLKAIGAHVARLTGPLARRRGTTTARLAAEWSLIVGPEIARHSLPERLSGRPGGGTLRLRVESTLALEVQHLAPQLIERINGHFGQPVVARLQIVQGPLPHRPVPRPTGPAPLDPVRRRALQQRLAPVADAGLRGALERLGRAILTRPRP